MAFIGSTTDYPVTAPTVDDTLLGVDGGAVKQFEAGEIAALGGLSGLRYTIDGASTADSDPGTGKLRFNNGDQALATQIFLDNSTAGSVSVATFLSELPQTGFVLIVQANNGALWHLYKVSAIVDGTGYRKLTVVSRGTGGALDSNAAVMVVFMPTVLVDTDGTLAANSDALVATQKATKTYVDAKVAGLSWKQAVRVATTAAGTLASSFENGDTVDGVVLATGDRILIKNQSTASENGIYVVAASGAPARATDADSGAELVNASVYVSEGTVGADTQWTCTTNAPITVGSTSLAFAQLTSGGGSGDVVGPASSVDSRIAAFDGTTGKLLKDGGKTIAGLRSPAIQSVTSSATVTPTFADDMVIVTAQAAALALANPTGSAIDGLGIAIRIKDNGTARAISYGSQYRAIGVTLPTTTVINKTLYLAMVFNNTDTKWDVVAVAQEA